MNNSSEQNNDKTIESDSKTGPALKTGYLTNLGLLVPTKYIYQKLLKESEIDDPVAKRRKFNKFVNLFTVKEYIQFKRNAYVREKILKAYRLKNIKINGFGEECLIVPRIKAKLMLSTKIIDSISKEFLDNSCKILSDNLELTRTLYDYQEACINYITEKYYIEEKQYTAYLSLSTGLGKTASAIALIHRLKVKTLVIVPSSKDLQSQWVDEINNVMPAAKVLAYNNNHKDKHLSDDYDVVVVIVNTFSKKTPDFVKTFGFVIIDEVHEFCSEKFSESLWTIQNVKYILGLSATPHERKDKLDTFIDQFLGEPLYAESIPGININKENFYGEVKKINYYGHHDYCDVILTKNGDTNNALTLKKVVSDPYRIKLILNCIKELYDHKDDHNIFVFAEHREYILILRKFIFNEFGEDNVLDLEDDSKEDILAPDKFAGTPSGLLTSPDSLNLDPLNIQVLRGGASKDLVKHVRREGAKIVLTTYGYSRRGIDLPNMTAMILVTPRRSGLMQVLGRITRKRSDLKKVRQVIDIVDSNTIYSGQFYDRKLVYDKKNWEITKTTIHWEDLRDSGEVSDDSEEEQKE
jgi:superfamily II DNA or RNA helicase